MATAPEQCTYPKCTNHGVTMFVTDLFETLGFACTEHRATMADQFGTDVVDMDKMKGLK